ncbi:MAG: radical SAM protein [Planctomycetota bacterium]|nr:radical SAM protein [Planctomycetota bacterium]
MKKVLFIAPLTEIYSGTYNYGAPSLGIWRLASFLIAHNHNVTVYDCNIHGSIEPYLKEDYHIIGISILNDSLRLSIEMLIKLRKHYPGAFLVAGGAESILNYQDILDNTDVDVIILGEGELPMLDLCEKKSIEQIKGIIYRKRNIEVTNDLLWEYFKNIDFNKMGYREYWEQNKKLGDDDGERVVRLVTSSHCNRGCSFCSITRLHEFACGRRIKPAFLSAEHIEILFSRIATQLPETTMIYFCEDSILPTLDRLDEFCDVLGRYKHKFKYMVQTETDKVSIETIQKLAQAGVVHITFGVENCSPRIRKLMHKPQNEEKIEDIINWCKEFNIRCYYLIILFSPEVTREDLEINHKTLTRWITEDNVKISIEPFMIPYKGAPVYYQDFEMDYQIVSLSNKKQLKHPYLIYPKDTTARTIMMKFKELLPVYIEQMNREEGHLHRSKNYTGKVMVRLLGDILSQNEQI